MAKDTIGKIDCPICALESDVREATSGKAYIMCSECGFQGFSRGGKSNQLIRQRMRPVDAKPTPQPEPKKDPAPAPIPAPPKKKGFLSELFPD